ncbi:helix-turn-helix transcriptional regulator [Actinomadura rubrisoli]|uniref:Helix-turn-helix transcriptional regulator n=1 Tax=Actinomadura rubrisoli TaxID=2530368 RepID=A0A4R5C9G7_9ACTN|nr:helix-turn-helix transcriptional regulator [Actinomadura rubrisoli]TDD95419.1 helix-turn-helix transcriptional regulator [Actinomadura rubrisoli]
MSPPLVGRSAELGQLRQALAAAPGAVLVGGEAGLGKTRLIREFAAVLTRPDGPRARLLLGGCLELGSDGLPFAPFTTVLRGLVRDIGIDGVAGLVPRGDTGCLARLLPEFGEPESDAASGEERARLFEVVLTLLERLAERGPVVLVIEDAHWADRSTRDLLSFLMRNVTAVPLLIVMTYRVDELHRTHPLRPLLAGLERVERVRRLELARLERADVDALVTEILGQAPPPGLIDRIAARSEGNPLFVEALLDDDGTLACELPESLRDLLLAGVQRLPEETQDVLRDASGGGTRIEHALLAAVSGLDDAALTRVLRPAVAANVLVVDGDGYAFRHALIREAVHDDLLPGEYTRLHTRYAQALENDPGLVPSGRLWVELSHHWLAAHDTTWALVASWRAAADARKALAYAECLTMLSRVLELWERVPDAAERIGADHVKVLEDAAFAADQAGEYDRGIKLASAALRDIEAAGASGVRGPAEVRARSAALLELRARMYYQVARPGFVEDLRAAEKALRGDPPTALRARVLTTLATYVRLTTDIDEARAAASESLAIARELADPVTEADALMTLFCADIDYDSHAAAYASPAAPLADVEAAVLRSGDQRVRLRYAVVKSHYLEGAGRHEEAAAVARRGTEKARELGVTRTQGSFLCINQAEPLVSLGRWDEAVAVLKQAMDQDPAITIRTSLLVLSGEVALARGDLPTARERLAAAREVMTLKMKWLKTQDYFATLRLEARFALAEGRPADALDAVREVIDKSGLPDDARYAWPVLVIGATACAELGAATPATASSEASAALEHIVGRAARLQVAGPLQAAYRLMFNAEADRARGVLDQPAWDAAADTWHTLGNPFNRAEALARAAEAALAGGDHEGAAERLGAASEIAQDLGAAPLAACVDDLLRRTRAPRRGGAETAAPLGLTPREYEVLRLVAEGRSNRDIAETLFISAKTASVHVSNILGKLEVTSRGEAAATAHRLALFATSRREAEARN